jgi:hypothetical protein
MDVVLILTYMYSFAPPGANPTVTVVHDWKKTQAKREHHELCTTKSHVFAFQQLYSSITTNSASHFSLFGGVWGV